MEKEIVVAIIGAGATVIAALIGTAFWRRRKYEEEALPSNQTPPTTGSILNNYGTIIQQISQDESVPLEALRGILESMGEKALAEADPEKIEQLLRAKAKDYLSLEQELRILKGDDDPEVQRLREAARQALQAGRLQDVDELLRQAEERVHTIEENSHETWLASRKRRAEIISERASAARLQDNPTAYRKAADLFNEAARLVTDDAHKAREYQLQQASVLQSLGNEFGDNDALREAIALHGQILSGIDRATNPLDWAKTQNRLGIALRTLGKREGNKKLLNEAVIAYRSALEEYPRERVPLDWAKIQNNLGNALRTLGELEGDKKLLNEVVAAYRAALEERTRERTPLDWATTRNNLGSALKTLGELEGDKKLLNEAVAAYRAALEERTRERVPLKWAMTQNNLGTALKTLGELEGDKKLLNEAVAAYRAALEERTRERLPLDWATTQNNLGAALQTLGEQEGGKVGTAYLNEAVAAYRAALEERTRERVPLDWAGTQNNLGVALRTLGKQEGDTKLLEKAVAAHRAALSTYEASGASRNAENARRSLALSEAVLASVRKD
jgi:tetratricopeptide (TPR) repeat protein